MSIPQASADLSHRVDALLTAQHDALIRFRRDLHAHPELSWKEERTAQKIEEALQALGIASSRVIGTAVIVDIPGSADLPRVIYRGDIDALPIVDTKDPHAVAWASRHQGQCHACGHDVHATIALAVAHCVHTLRDALVAPVRIIFQPAEEVLPSGAAALADAGELDGASAALALHVDPSRDVGEVAWLTGPITSATDTFHLHVKGSAGHSARPHLAHDAIAAAAEITQQLYGLARRFVNPLHTAVVSVGRIEAGNAPNVIAGSATLAGTVRVLNLDDRSHLHNALRVTAERAAALHGCTVTTDIGLGAPPVRNDEALAALVRTTAASILGDNSVVQLDYPSTGAEDFGVFSDHMRTFMMRLGCGVPNERRRHLHEEGFDLHEDAVLIGARIMARAILALSQHGG